MNPIGVVGLGTVGSALLEGLQHAGLPAFGFDPYLMVGELPVLADCELVFVCVPTPPDPEGALDTSAVWKAVSDIDGILPDGAIVVMKSTVPPGTSDKLAEDFPRLEFASVPEFLVAARPMETLTRPDRVVVGARSAASGAAIAEVMRRVAPGAPIVMLTPIQAELAKLSANAMLAAKVSMANELALVCERFAVDWSDVQAAVGLDRRIGLDHLSVTAERGFGGGCLPKDLGGLVAASQARGYAPTLLTAIREFNDSIRAREAAWLPAEVRR